jgi:flagellar biosynthesis/type III secretory pathway protein FliH
MESEQAQIDRNLTKTVEKFAASIAPLFDDYRELALQLKQDLPKVAFSMTRKIAGQALKENAQAAVDEMALHCVEIMISEPKLNVTVNDKLAPTLEAKLKQLATRLQSACDIVVVANADMSPSDCRIDWKHGSAGRHSEHMWEELQNAVGLMSSGGKHDIENKLKLVKEQLLQAAQQELQPSTKE